MKDLLNAVRAEREMQQLGRPVSFIANAMRWSINPANKMVLAACWQRSWEAM